MSDADSTGAAYEGHIVIGNIRTQDAPPEVGVLTLRFVHYPGAQQLILWLPQSGYLGYGDVTVARDGKVIEQETVRDRLNGSVQILWDTLAWPPGDYRIAITHTDGWRHEAALQKLEAGVAAPQPEPPPTPPPPDTPIVYRDGFGNVIPDTDLEIRAQAQVKLARTFGRRLEYEGTARAGKVIYIDPVHRIVFENELCGGELQATIYISAAAHWEAATGAPLSLRDEIVAFVAQRVQQEQASNWKYRITDASIDFY
ncbi:MAG: hypothetical protein ABMA14_25440 [Hyphomonadaceae bacterium]